MLQTEFDFTLPRGFVDADGNLHREGVMRLATAYDEVAPVRPAEFVVVRISLFDGGTDVEEL